MEDIAPPPDSSFTSYDEAYNALKDHGMEHGYGFVLNRSKPAHSDTKTRYYYHCDRFKRYQSQAKLFSTSTRTTGCPFKLIIFKVADEEWKLEVRDKNHNHGRSLNSSAHNVYRKRTQTQKDTIQAMTYAGVRPMQIMAAVQKEDPDSLVSATDIRSERKAIREKNLNGRSPIETLLDDLSTPDWVFALKRDSENHVQCLFFAHKKQIELLLANPDILLMDCTYRTNKYRMPLLHILGCTNLQTFFSAGFCFLRNETEDDYYWAISNFILKTGALQPNALISDQEDALKLAATRLFPSVPQLLCVWHINKIVQTKAQQTWRDADGTTKEEKQAISAQRAQFMKRWTQVVYAKYPLPFTLKWNELLKDYADQQELCKYLTKNQWNTRRQWAAAWTSQHRHYNTITSSPVEGMHKVLKDYLMTSRGDPLRVVGRIEQMVASQYNKYRKQLASAKHSLKFKHSLEAMPFLPPGIHEAVTPPAIDRIREQDLLRQKERRPRQGGYPPCSGLFQKINGLPCRHTIQIALGSNSTLALTTIDNHWRYQREQSLAEQPSPRPYQSIQEPLPAQPRGAPRRNESSNRRDQPAFERTVPPSRPQIARQTLPEILQSLDTSVTVTIPTSTLAISTVTTSVSTSIPALASPDLIASPPSSQSSIRSTIRVAVTMAQSPPQPSPVQPTWRPPSFDEFLADIEERKHQPILDNCPDILTATNYLEETGQVDDPVELIEARRMALDGSGIYADCTPLMAWNYHFGDKEAFYRERFAQVRSLNPLFGSPPAVSRQRPKRPAAEAASKAWKGLSPRKRQRQQ